MATIIKNISEGRNELDYVQEKNSLRKKEKKGVKLYDIRLPITTIIDQLISFDCD